MRITVCIVTSRVHDASRHSLERLQETVHAKKVVPWLWCPTASKTIPRLGKSSVANTVCYTRKESNEENTLSQVF